MIIRIEKMQFKMNILLREQRYKEQEEKELKEEDLNQDLNMIVDINKYQPVANQGPNHVDSQSFSMSVLNKSGSNPPRYYGLHNNEFHISNRESKVTIEQPPNLFNDLPSGYSPHSPSKYFRTTNLFNPQSS